MNDRRAKIFEVAAGLLIVIGWVVLACFTVLTSGGCSSSSAKQEASGKRITFVAPTPTPVEIFWIDSAGNIGLRGAEAIVPGAPPAADDPKGPKYSPSCRKSAAMNGDGTLTICMNTAVGRTLADKLGIGWTSVNSEKR